MNEYMQAMIVNIHSSTNRTLASVDSLAHTETSMLTLMGPIGMRFGVIDVQLDLPLGIVLALTDR